MQAESDGFRQSGHEARYFLKCAAIASTVAPSDAGGALLKRAISKVHAMDKALKIAPGAS